MRVGQPDYIKILDFVPLGKLRKEQSGDANMSEKNCHDIGACELCLTYRPANADTGLALPVQKNPVDQICFVTFVAC